MAPFDLMFNLSPGLRKKQLSVSTVVMLYGEAPEHCASAGGASVGAIAKAPIFAACMAHERDARDGRRARFCFFIFPPRSFSFTLCGVFPRRNIGRILCAIEPFFG